FAISRIGESREDTSVLYRAGRIQGLPSGRVDEMSTTAVQRADGRWKKGVSGNPAGRPAGSPNRSQAHLREILAGDAERGVKAVVQAAIGGDMVAAKLVFDRILPRRSCRPLEGLVLPPITTVNEAVGAINAIANATLQGVL